MARKYSDKNRDCKIFCGLCEGVDSPFGLPPALRMGKPKDYGVIL